MKVPVLILGFRKAHYYNYQLIKSLFYYKFFNITHK